LVGPSTNGFKAELRDIVAEPSVNNHATILDPALAAGENELRHKETVVKRLATTGPRQSENSAVTVPNDPLLRHLKA
jgi:hypothetical protein